MILMAALRQIALDSEHIVLGLAVHSYEVVYLIGCVLFLTHMTILKSVVSFILDYFTNAVSSMMALTLYARVAHVFGLAAAIGFHPNFRTQNKFIEKLLAILIFFFAILALLSNRPTLFSNVGAR